MNLTPSQLSQARAQWKWRGLERPPFAAKPSADQISVWDFPRPPEIVRENREIIVKWGQLEVARTNASWAVRETSHPPTFYIPVSNVKITLLQAAGDGSFCEWKGPAKYWHLVSNSDQLSSVAWSYPSPLKGAEPLAECIAFYAKDLDCWVGGAKALPQGGGFYGGWITPDLAGPFKGDPGSSGW